MKILSRTRTKARHANQGNAMVETALTLPVMILMLFGVFSGGIILERYMTVLQLTRNGAAMFSRGADFSTSDTKQHLLRGADGLNMTLTGGDGVIYLTRIVKADPGTANEDLGVIAERHVVGQASYKSSALGTPASGIMQSDGTVTDPMNEPTAVATVPSTLVAALPYGTSMHVVEVFHDSSELVLSDMWPSNGQMAAFAYF